jgi:hypothetical protein
MASKSTLTYAQRAARHPNPLVKKLFEIADRKKTNVVLSADLTTTKELLAIADSELPLRTPHHPPLLTNHPLPSLPGSSEMGVNEQ